MIVDFGSVDGDWVGACLHRPEVTDYTIADTNCTAARGTKGKTELTYKAGPSGRWTVAFLDVSDAASREGGCISPGYLDEERFDSSEEPVKVAPQYCKLNVSYEFTVNVKTYTATTLRIGPTVVEANKRATFAGSVKGSGVAGGKVKLDYYARGWKTFATVNVGGNGSFSYKTRFTGPGTYRIRARYAGDATHLPSTVVISVRVI